MLAEKQKEILNKAELGTIGQALWLSLMEASRSEMEHQGFKLNDLQEERLGVHLVALVGRQQKREFFPDLDEALMEEVSPWGWELTEKVTRLLNIPEWETSKTEQFLLAIHFEAAKVENAATWSIDRGDLFKKIKELNQSVPASQEF